MNNATDWVINWKGLNMNKIFFDIVIGFYFVCCVFCVFYFMLSGGSRLFASIVDKGSFLSNPIVQCLQTTRRNKELYDFNLIGAVILMHFSHTISLQLKHEYARGNILLSGLVNGIIVCVAS